MGRISREARLLFIMLWTICDDSGRTRAASRMLASLLFPYDDDAPKLIDKWLAELRDQSCIDLYEVDDNLYLQIRNWLKHQKIDKPSPSRLPEFGESSRTLVELSRKVATDLGPRTKDLPPISPKGGFDEFWKAYPRKQAKARAQKAWAALSPNSELQTIILQALVKQRASAEWQRDEGKFVPHPASWLTGCRWEDSAPAAPPAEANPAISEAVARSQLQAEINSRKKLRLPEMTEAERDAFLAKFRLNGVAEPEAAYQH
jgi:hypothetical protein